MSKTQQYTLQRDHIAAVVTDPWKAVNMESFANIVLYLLSAVGGATVLWQALKVLVSKWLDDKLKRGLQSLRHDHEREIELLRAGLTKSFDRASKLHHREFEVLPAVWEKVADAFWTANSLVHPFQEYPDLERMGAQELSEFLEGSPLRAWERMKIQSSDSMNTEYANLIYWHRYSKAMDALRTAISAVARSGIFIADDVHIKLSAITDQVHTALVESEINKSCPPLSPVDKLKGGEKWMRGEGREAMNQAEAAIKDRLWSRNSN